jgi:hypothetical protein
MGFFHILLDVSPLAKMFLKASIENKPRGGYEKAHAQYEADVKAERRRKMEERKKGKD